VRTVLGITAEAQSAQRRGFVCWEMPTNKNVLPSRRKVVQIKAGSGVVVSE
jgi:hypothetical protein